MPDDRRRVLDRHINERYQVRHLITAAEAAMKAEDIPEDVRDPCGVPPALRRTARGSGLANRRRTGAGP